MQYGSKGFAAASRIPDFSDSLGTTIPRIIFHTARRPRSCPIIPHIPAFCPTLGCRKGWFRSREGLRSGLGVQEGVVSLPGGSAKGTRGAGRVVLLPGRAREVVPGCRKGRFRSREGLRRGLGVQEGVVLLPGGPEKWPRGAGRGGFAPRRAREVVPGCRKGWFCSRRVCRG